LNHAISGEALPELFPTGETAELFAETETVEDNLQRAEGVWKRLAARAGREAMQQIHAAFLSDDPGIGAVLARVLIRLWRGGGGLLTDPRDPGLVRVSKAAMRTRREAHAMLGLIRLAELADGTWYAGIRPDCDILPLVADHFMARFPGMAWILHDHRRSTAVLHAPGKGWTTVRGFTVACAGRDGLPLSAGEQTIRNAWRVYHQAVAIQERRNPRLQSGHMPRKYWEYLQEMAVIPEEDSTRANHGDTEVSV